jgi:putative copper export protein
MKQSGLTLTTMLILSVALYMIVAFWFQLGSESARAIAGIPLLWAAQLFELAHRHQDREDLASGRAERAATFHEFGITWPWVIIISLFLTFGLLEIVTDYMTAYLFFGKIGIYNLSRDAISNADFSDVDYLYSTSAR